MIKVLSLSLQRISFWFQKNFFSASEPPRKNCSRNHSSSKNDEDIFGSISQKQQMFHIGLQNNLPSFVVQKAI